MANIDADLSNEALKNTGLLKKLTGSDDIPAEEKFRNPFHFKNHAKLIFSANQIPKTPDETDAFFARLIIINFLNQYLGDNNRSMAYQEINNGKRDVRVIKCRSSEIA
jgi:phage/plasmid-associated DNA primase